MKVREKTLEARCEGCSKQYADCHPVEFSSDESVLVLCGMCVALVRRILGIVSVKECEA